MRGKGRSQLSILRYCGILAGSIRAESDDNALRVGSPSPYAAIHQLGGTISMQAGTRYIAGRRFAKRSETPGGRDVAIGARSITIPARPFLGVAPRDVEGILEAAEDWLNL